MQTDKFTTGRKKDPSVKNYDKPHRASMIKTCKTCGLHYYPGANGYELISEYCGQDYYRKKRWGH